LWLIIGRLLPATVLSTLFARWLAERLAPLAPMWSVVAGLPAVAVAFAVTGVLTRGVPMPRPARTGAHR
jgi:hypothetical protein